MADIKEENSIFCELDHVAEIRCMYCLCLLGHKPGFRSPGAVSHGIGECCLELSARWMSGEFALVGGL